MRFRRVEEVLVCLEALLADPDVVVLRVKNRLDPDHDAETTGGYRSALLFRTSSLMQHSTGPKCRQPPASGGWGHILGPNLSPWSRVGLCRRC